MSNFKKLFHAKRILAMILAVAMVVTMLPSTTYAASVTDSEPDGSSEAVAADLETTEDTTAAEESADTADNEAVNGETAPTAVPALDGEEEDGGTPALETTLSMQLTDKETTKEYQGNEVFDSVNSLKSKVTVTVDGKKVVPASDDLTLTWKQVAEDGSLMEMPDGTTAPVNAGNYKLCVELAAKEGSYKAATIEGGVTFTITPAPLAVTVEKGSIAAGSKAGEITADGGYAEGYGDLTFFYLKYEPKSSDLAVTVSVRDALTGKVLEADEVLRKTGNYVLDFTVDFTEAGKIKANGNYTLTPAASQDAVIGELIPSFVSITLADAYAESGKITYTYTGEAVKAPVNGTDFTVKVQYDNGQKNENGHSVYADIPDAQVTEGWYELKAVKEYVDNEGNAQTEYKWVKLEEAPSQVGSYAYRISYDGKPGIYAKSYRDISVEIEPVKVVLKPELSAKAKFYHEMSEQDVLAQIDYSVYDAQTPEKAVEKFDKTTAWGASYDDTEVTQYYEPVFLLQYESKEEDGSIIWEDNKGKALDSTKNYRVIFSGKKSVYHSNGEGKSLPINEIVNGIHQNYMAETDYDSVLSVYAVELTVEEGTKTVMDVSEITQGLGGKGDSLDNVYTKVYDGKMLYQARADYKKAVVKAGDTTVAKNTDKSLTYTWYEYTAGMDITDYEFSVNTNEPYTEEETNPFWDEDNWEEWSEDTSTPLYAGIYRLDINYKDQEGNNYLSSQASVYYVIERQPVKVTFSGEYKALTGTSFSDFFKKFEEEQRDSFSVQTVGENGGTTLDWKDTEDYLIEFYIEETPLVAAADGQEGAFDPQTRVRYHYCEKDGMSYQVVDADGNPVKEEVLNSYGDYRSEVFKENAQYKLTAELICYYNDYTNQANVVEELTILKQNDEESATQVHRVRSQESLNDKADILVEAMGENSLTIQVDKDKLNTLEKEYDGTAFDLNAVLGEGAVKVVKTEDGTTQVSDVALTYEWYGKKYTSKDYYYWEYLQEAVDAGEYTLYASFAGDTTYAKCNRVEVARVTITPRKLTVTPVIGKTVTAGTRVGGLYGDVTFQQAIKVEGYTDKDKKALTYNEKSDTYQWEAWGTNTLGCSVYDEEGTVLPSNTVLKGDKTYTIKVGARLSYLPYRWNYEVEYTNVSFTTVRGNSEVWTQRSYHLTSEYLTNEVERADIFVSVKDEINGMTHTITTLSAIPYSYHTLTNDGSRREGNFLEVYIDAPAEYDGTVPDTVMYQNSIEAQGGVASVGEECLWVLLDASKQDTQTFDIRWEDGYVEHFIFDFTKAELMGNLAEAVAPKTLAFQTPVTKMAVGEVQELDLKMTKVQKNDIVCIAYESDNKEVLSVDENGKVTALKTGTASISAYPVKIVNGQKTAIDNAKTAKVKITVKDVSAPKLKKADAKDDYVTVQYSFMEEGYRREIYVLEGKNVKAAEFEKKIASMKNGQWESIFAIAPQYLDANAESSMYPYDKNGKADKSTVEVSLYGLEYSTDYTVYVRNVSGARTLEDGSQVSLSAAGSVKSFVTTKVQVECLWIDVLDSEYVYLNNEEPYYVVKLSDGKAKTHVLGQYPEKAENPAAEEYDGVWYDLPLSKELQKTYVNPKLTYEVVGWNRQHTEIASVDKKGNLTLKGAGSFWMRVTDTTTGCTSASVKVVITADADRITGNKVKLEVGKEIDLENLLTYYQGKKKLIGDFDRQVVIDEALTKAFTDNEYFELDAEQGTVKAIKEGGTLQLNLTDAYVNASAAVTLTSTALTPVKNLKLVNAKTLELRVTSLTDSWAVVQFEYEGGADAFRFEVTDERGRLIQSRYITKKVLESEYYTKGTDGKYYYIYVFGGLTQQSKYNLTITPVYGDVMAKAAKLSVKTTKIPASGYRLNTWDKNAGINIAVVTDNWDLIENVERNKRFVSGNTYTLYAAPDNSKAESTASDSLIWSSSNSKVAVVKANSGTYFASFKALKAGTTTIEVKSKLTKEVIARYDVTVTSVGDAYGIGRRYYEDNEPDELEEPQDVQDVGLEAGTRKYISVKAGSEKWISYTAPKDGIYEFMIYSGDVEFYSTLGGKPLEKENDWFAKKMAARETVYFKLSSSTDIEIEYLEVEALSVTRKITVESGEYKESAAVFTAPEDGIYAFETCGNDTISYSTVAIFDDSSFKKVLYAGNDYGNTRCWYEMTKGEQVYVTVFGVCKDANSFELKVGKFSPKQLTEESSITVKKGKGEYEYLSFTAPEASGYTFAVQANSNVRVALYDRINGDALNKFEADANSYKTCDMWLEAGETVYLGITGRWTSNGIDAVLSVSRLQKAEAEKEMEVSVEPHESKSIYFKADEAGFYTFQTSREEGSDLSMTILSLPGNISDGDEKEKDGIIIKESDFLLGGTKQCIYLYNNSDVKADVKLSVTRHKSEAVGLDAKEAFTIGDENKLYEFTATETGVYKITVEGKEVTQSPSTKQSGVSITFYGNNGYLGSWSSSDSAAGTGEFSVPLVAGQKCVMLAKKDGSDSQTCALRVTKEQALSFEENKAEIEKNSNAWITFTAEESGVYDFTAVQTQGATTDNENQVVYYLNSSAIEEFGSFENNTSHTIQAAVAKGQTVFIALKNDNDTAVQVTVQKEKLAALTLTDSVIADLDEGEVKWMTFTAKKRGNYEFYSKINAGSESNDSKVSVYRETNLTEAFDEDDDDGNGYNFRILVSMEEGETVFLKAQESGENEAIHFSVYAKAK